MPGYNLAFDNVHAVEFSRTKRTRDPALEDLRSKQLWNRTTPMDQAETTRFPIPTYVKTSTWNEPEDGFETLPHESRIASDPISGRMSPLEAGELRIGTISGRCPSRSAAPLG
jgi:hypothetical protein